MGKKTPPFPEYEEWTTSRFWSFIRSTLRRAWTRWPPRYQALNDAKRTVTGKRHKYEYKCSSCKKWFKQKEIQTDHIEEVGSLKDYEDLPDFVRRLFVAKDKIQVMCKSCHQGKTNDSRQSKD